MIPSFAVADVQKDRVWVAPPYFRPLKGVPRDITIAEGGPTHVRSSLSSHTTARKRGLSYEEQALTLLSQRYPTIWIHPVIKFYDDSGLRMAIPDALLIDPEYNTVVLFEVKIRHTLDAYWQLWKLYKPLLEALRYGKVYCVEVVKSYDPSCVWPVECELVDDLSHGYSPDRVTIYRHSGVRKRGRRKS